ncbi:type II toxin-antitoxin system RelE/ParE family toxin [Candidatus Fermentibacterales bacterium]|nr:type II toxin-antitoxin system RelE/ParE family toxin [Candidatus Fermentibacterales bacterium]
MASYRILIRESVYKDIDRIPKKDVGRIVRAIESLADDPRPVQSRKLSGEEKYRLRCGSCRVLYEIRPEELVVCVVRARHRRDAYR